MDKAQQFQVHRPRLFSLAYRMLALGAPAGRVPDLAGPKVYPADRLARTWLRATGKRRPHGRATPTAASTPSRVGPPERGDARELMLGTDEAHLGFRLSILSDGQHVTFTTAVTLNNRRGHLYWALVRHFHLAVVRAMARRAHREIALRAASPMS